MRKLVTSFIASALLSSVMLVHAENGSDPAAAEEASA